jgi:hypothetical protein
MNNHSENNSLLKQPSAWIPIAISLLAFTMILVYVKIFSIVQNEDEGAPARIFQLLMVLQLPIIAYFGIKWLPKQPKQSLMVLALQAVAWILLIVTIIFLESL